MTNANVIKWAAFYLALWVLAAVLGLALVGAGVALGGTSALPLYRAGTSLNRIAVTAGPGLALIALGVLAWQFVSAVALIKAVTAAFAEETAGQLNTESMKSDILSVLDDRLAEMHQEIVGTRQLVDRLSRNEAAAEFEFSNE